MPDVPGPTEGAGGDAILDLAPCGFATIALGGPVLAINRTLLDWLGMERDDVVGRLRFADLVTRSAAAYAQTHLVPMLLVEGGVREIALTMARADGERLPVLINALLDRTDPERPVVRVAVFDARERRRYEQQLLRAKQQAEAYEERSLQLSRTLQATLIPPSPPHVPHLDVGAAYRPAGDGTEVGGDFYDVFQTARGEWVVALGDVTGKGVDAAVVTALVRYSLRAATVDHDSPAAALAVVNRIVLDHETDRFCTIVLLRLSRASGSWQATVCCGGHPLPIRTGPDGPPTPVGRPGALIGVLDDPELHDVTIDLDPGEELVLFTDGVTEARRGDEEYGDDRLLAELVERRPDANATVEHVLERVLDFQGGRARDDIAVVAVRVPEDR